VTIWDAVLTGLQRAYRTPRLVFFAWLVNVALALVVAVPMFSTLDSYIGGTVYEESLRERMSANWWRSFKTDHEGDAVVGALDYSIMGSAGFLKHAQSVLEGDLVVSAARFVTDLVIDWTVSWNDGGFLVVLGLIAMVVHTVLSAGFLSAYTGDYPPTIGEFLSAGGRHFGPFLRLAGIVFVLQAAILYPALRWFASEIAQRTAESPSELTPFVWYMVRAVVALGLFFLLSLVADYGRILLVAGRQRDALSALRGGISFVFRHLRVTAGIGLIYLIAVVVLMAIYGLMEQPMPRHSAPFVLLVIVFQQAYMIIRQFLRAATYASEMDVFQESGRAS